MATGDITGLILFLDDGQVIRIGREQIYERQLWTTKEPHDDIWTHGRFAFDTTVAPDEPTLADIDLLNDGRQPQSILSARSV